MADPSTEVANVQNWYDQTPKWIVTGALAIWPAAVNEMKRQSNSATQHRRNAVAAKMDVSTEYSVLLMR